MKKLLISILTILSVLSFAFGLTACAQDGKDGRDGTNGQDGLSAYELYKKYHTDYTKTEEQFIDDLINGELGEKKDKNEQGLAFYMQDDGTYSVGVGYAEGLSRIVIPATYNGKNVIKIKDNFINYTSDANKTLKEIVIPDSVTEIGNRAFYKCNALEKITLSQNLVSIGEYAFYYCSSLKEIKIPSLVKTIGKFTFEKCVKLVKLTLSSKLEKIDKYAFYDCTSLTSITLPTTLTTICDNAFNGCYKLAEVINKSSIVINRGERDNGYIGKYALEVKTSGSSGIKTFNNYSFYTVDGTSYLVDYVGTDTTLTLPDNYLGNAYAINDYAFYGYDNITKIILPSTLLSIGDEAFSDCDSLSYYKVGGMCYLGSATNHYLALIKPDDDSYELYNCSVKSGCKFICSSAFNFCTTLIDIEIPKSVTSIASYTFSGCYELKTITFLDTENWYKTPNKDEFYAKDGGELTDVTDESENATNLAETYNAYYWYKLDK